MEYIIGIDIGTSGTKAIAFTRQGQVLTSDYQSYTAFSLKTGENELDPDLLLEATVDTIARLVKSMAAPTGLLGICFSCAMHSLIAVDKDGMALTAMITWADLRSKAYAAKIRFTDQGRKIYERTGTPIHPMSPFCKIMWVRDHQPGIFAKTHKFISIKEYIWFRFFGKFIVDHSVASGTGLFDIYSLQWCADALEMAGIGREHLSAPVSTTYQEMDLISEYRTRMNLPVQIPFIVGATDGCLANLGSNTLLPGEMALTIGTSGAARMTTAQPPHDPQERIFNYILTESIYVSGGPVNNGGNTVKWFVDNFMQNSASSSTEFASCVQEAGAVPPGSDGLIFLPYLLGERAPVWDANARAVFFGILAHHGSPFFLRAVMEGVVFTLYQIGLSLEQTIGSIEKIYASGGFIQSPLWLQMVADVFNRDVHVTHVVDASAIGAAMLGLYALGIIESLEETRAMIHIQQSYYPDKKNHAAYMKNFSVFDGLYGKLKDDFGKINQA